MKKSLFMLALLPLVATAQMGTSEQIKPRIGIVIINPEDIKAGKLTQHHSAIMDIIQQIKQNKQVEPLVNIKEIVTNNARVNDVFQAIAQAARAIKADIANAESTSLDIKATGKDLHALHKHLLALQSAAEQAGVAQKIQNNFKNLRAALNEALQNEAMMLEKRAQELKNSGQITEAKQVQNLAKVLKRKPKTKLLGSRTERVSEPKPTRSGKRVKMMNTYYPHKTQGASAY